MPKISDAATWRIDHNTYSNIPSFFHRKQTRIVRLRKLKDKPDFEENSF